MIKQMERYEYQKKTLKKVRTVRSCALAIQPIVNKHFINFEVDELEDDDSDSADNVERELKKKSKNCAYTETALDHIISKLVTENKSHDIIIMITPSSRHKDQYKLHAIEKKSRTHLGMVSVKQNELGKLKKSKIFEQFSIVIGTRYIDVKTVAVGNAAISNLMNIISSSGCRLTENDIVESFSKNSAPYKKSPYTIQLCNRNESKNDNDNNNMNCSSDGYNTQSSAILKNPETILHSENENCKDSNIIITEDELLTLMAEINTLSRFKERDIDRFFIIAEHYKFHIKIRPELCRRGPAYLFNGTQTEYLCRFHLECFMSSAKIEPDSNKNCKYVSSVLLDNEVLQMQLTKHKQLSENIDIIEDVYDILPFIPKILKRILCKICEFFHLEFIYDVMGEILYEFCKNFVYW